MFEKLTAEVDVAESIASVILVIAHSSYSTDLSDAAWALVSPLLPPARTGGRRRTTDLRAVLDAIFYLLRTGCQWRLIPREFPPWGTVYDYFRNWKNAGVWGCIQAALYEQTRAQAGRSECIRCDYGWPVGKDDRTRRSPRLRRVQASERTQASYSGRYTGAANRESSRTGQHLGSICR